MAEVPEMSSSTPEELLAAGRRHLAVRDYTSAAETLATACELLAKKHGEFADECAEAYLWYGKSLLGLSREENGYLGDGVAGGNNEDGDNEEENGEENAEAEQKNGEIATEDGDDEENKAEGTKENDKTEPESTTKDEEPGSSTENEEKPGTSNGDVNDDSVVNLDNEDDVDNLQLAWEMLDLSRNILQKRAENGKDVRALLAEVHLALGEVALESETYDKAVADMISCLDIQKELYKSDDRHIAETHYQIGLANSLASNFEDAITHFKNAANILETRIKTLENPKTVSECATVKKYATTDPFYSVEGEIKELKELLPEIQEKIQDMMDYKAETIKRVRETLCPSNGESSNGAGSSKTEQKASDISHLIKRKRKNSEEGGSAPKRVNT
ncbi:protein HGV2 [Danaus plexippus]|uniref:protein HGV2 n=1 Tax=Danaus plexippus TaxID=13037 RepID=UPI002AB295D6|nr:protein HGV2 [Danaus plexippus]